LKFYSPEEAIIAYNEGQVDLHAIVECKVYDLDENGKSVLHMKKTTIGRILFNEHVPKEAGYIDQLLTKKALARYYRIYFETYDTCCYCPSSSTILKI
jgi:DNA-directed RNA polymerase subunit beta'